MPLATGVVNLNLWLVAAYVTIEETHCEQILFRQDYYPLIWVWFIILAILVIMTIVDVFIAQETWVFFGPDKYSAKARDYLQQVKEAAPFHRLHVECFHIENIAHLRWGGKRMDNERKKVVTYRVGRGSIMLCVRLTTRSGTQIRDIKLINFSIER